MSYVVNGTELETDKDGYLLEPDFSDEVIDVIAAAEGLSLGEDHRFVINYMRERYKEDGQTPNFRHMMKELGDEDPKYDKKYLYTLFPMGPAKQAAKVGGLPQPLGKAGY